MRTTERLMSSLAADLTLIDDNLAEVRDESQRANLLERRAAIDAAFVDLRAGVAGPALLWAVGEYLAGQPRSDAARPRTTARGEAAGNRNGIY